MVTRIPSTLCSILTAICFVVAGCDHSPPVTDDWPNFLGPHHNGTSTGQSVKLDWPDKGPNEQWRIEIGTGYSSPVVADDKLILMHRVGDEEIVECFDAVSGQSQWQHRYPTTYECEFEYSNGPYSTPAIEDGRVYAWGAEGTLRCLSLANGELLWQRDLHKEYEAELGMFPVAGSIFIHDGRILLNVGGVEQQAGVIALDQQTGKTVWTATEHGPGDATAVATTIHNQNYVLMFTADGLVSLDPQTGSVHWEYPFRATALDTSNATTPAVWQDLVLISAYKVGCACLRILPDGSFEELWRERRNLMCQFHNLIVRDGYVYGFSANDHTLRCLDMTTGEVLWKWEPEHGRGQMVAVEEHLLILFEDGHLASVGVTPEGWTEESTTKEPVVSARCFSSPALANRRLYLRGDHDLACLNLLP